MELYGQFFSIVLLPCCFSFLRNTPRCRTLLSHTARIAHCTERADCNGMATPSPVIWPEWFTPSLRLSGTGSCTPLTQRDSREGLRANATPCHFPTSCRPLIANFNLTATARSPIDLRRANQQVRAPYFIAMLACATKLDHTPPLAGLRYSHFPVARRPTTQALPRISAIGSSYLLCIAKTKVICWMRNEKEDFRSRKV